MEQKTSTTLQMCWVVLLQRVNVEIQNFTWDINVHALHFFLNHTGIASQCVTSMLTQSFLIFVESKWSAESNKPIGPYQLYMNFHFYTVAWCTGIKTLNVSTKEIVKAYSTIVHSFIRLLSFNGVLFSLRDRSA